MTDPGERKHRLSAALRENLKRRKAQARHRREEDAGPQGEPRRDDGEAGRGEPARSSDGE